MDQLDHALSIDKNILELEQLFDRMISRLKQISNNKLTGGNISDAIEAANEGLHNASVILDCKPVADDITAGGVSPADNKDALRKIHQVAHFVTSDASTAAAASVADNATVRSAYDIDTLQSETQHAFNGLSTDYSSSAPIVDCKNAAPQKSRNVHFYDAFYEEDQSAQSAQPAQPAQPAQLAPTLPTYTVRPAQSARDSTSRYPIEERCLSEKARDANYLKNVKCVPDPRTVPRSKLRSYHADARDDARDYPADTKADTTRFYRQAFQAHPAPQAYQAPPVYSANRPPAMRRDSHDVSQSGSEYIYECDIYPSDEEYQPHDYESRHMPSQPVNTRHMSSQPVNTRHMSSQPVDTRRADTRRADTRRADTRRVDTRIGEQSPIGINSARTIKPYWKEL